MVPTGHVHQRREKDVWAPLPALCCRLVSASGAAGSTSRRRTRSRWLVVRGSRSSGNGGH
eukprot:972039-Prymnesium_polylepis.2